MIMEYAAGPLLEKLASHIREVNLTSTPVTNIEPLKTLTGLQILDLSGTKITDIEPVKTLTGLQNLDLSGTKVTDISPLKTLTTTKIYWDEPQK